MALLLAIHVAATLFMTGVIWFVQIVHYPLFGQVPREAFASYAEMHAKRTTWVVGPVMSVELITAVVLLARDASAAHIAGMALVGIIWLSTALVQVPQHERLRRAFDKRVHAALVQGNWIRTVAWSARAVLVLWLISPSSS